MKVDRFTATPFRLPFRRPLLLAGKSVPARHGVAVELRDGAGRVGIGEAAPHPGAPAGVLADIGRQLGAVARALAAAPETDLDGWLCRLAPLCGGPARAAVEMALFDLAGKKANAPVADLLGGLRHRQVPVNAIVDQTAPAEAARAATEADRHGFRSIKLKIPTCDTAAAAAQVEAVRGAVGMRMSIRVDVNGQWSVAQALEAIPRLAAYDLEYVEQPVRTLADLVRVRRAVAVPIAADECVTDAAAVYEIAAAGAADVVVVKPALLGLREAAAVLRAARECGIDAVVTSTLDSSIGIAAALHLAATLPTPLRPCGLATAHLLAADIVRQPLVATGGCLELPSAPGLGIEVDPASLERWGVGDFAIDD